MQCYSETEKNLKKSVVIVSSCTFLFYTVFILRTTGNP